MSCIWVFWLQILASLTVTQLSLRVYQETLVCQPGATHLPLEPIREGKASSPNLPDACSDVSSLCLNAASLCCWSTVQQTRVWSAPSLCLGWPAPDRPISGYRGGQQPPLCPLLLHSSRRHLCPGSWTSALCSCAATQWEGRSSETLRRSRARHPVAMLTAESQGGRRPHLGKISHLRFSAVTSAQRKEGENPVTAALVSSGQMGGRET